MKQVLIRLFNKLFSTNHKDIRFSPFVWYFALLFLFSFSLLFFFGYIPDFSSPEIIPLNNAEKVAKSISQVVDHVEESMAKGGILEKDQSPNVKSECQELCEDLQYAAVITAKALGIVGICYAGGLISAAITVTVLEYFFGK